MGVAELELEPRLILNHCTVRLLVVKRSGGCGLTMGMEQPSELSPEVSIL